MAKVLKTVNHDWLGVRVTFDDRTVANVTWSRGGENVTVRPDDPKKAEALSLVVMENFRKLKDPAYPFDNLEQTADAMAAVGERARTFDDYIAGLKQALQVTGEKPKPRGAANAPEKTAASAARKGRGWVVNAFFPTGERVELKINASSVGMAMDPNVPSKFNEVTKLIFAVKQASLMSDDDVAAAAKTAAEGAADLNGWIDNMRAAFFPGAAPGMRR